jgi:phenylalanyl-tRNA synthetase beta chain
MKISESWLREWVNPTVSTTELAEQLTMAGLEVDSIESAAPEFSKVVVGEVVEVSPHPDADKLRVCQVNTGEQENLQIVCGASNVRAGLHVPAAVIGARLPGDFKIKKSKLRGVLSFGMLCGASELGLEESSAGLLELPDDAPVGTDIREYLNLDDQIIEVDLTPNRGDCLSIAGVAREVSVLNRIDLKPLSMKQPETGSEQQFQINIEAAQDCPRYLGRVIEGVDVGAQTPDWMQERLHKSGLRPVSPVVDVTNYVMLELGHPMHAFDLAKLDAGIIVRRAHDKEKLTLLDGKDIELSPQELVIADHKKALALAGIMGGLDSSVTDQTTDIFLECAFFQPVTIAGKARNFGMQTDSSHRFERGVDPQKLDMAIQRATQLILEICGGKAGPVQQCGSDQYLPQQDTIVLRQQQLQRILGISLDKEQVEDILVRLGMDISSNEQGWDVVAPSFRFDIAIEADLIEEVGRIYGYNRLPTKAFVGAMHMPTVSEFAMEQNDIHQRLFDRGYQEIITYSFVDPAVQSILDPEANAIELANPISSDMSVMRSHLWTGLIQTIDYNIKRQQERLRFFEYGLKFNRQDNEIKQINVISGAVCGTVIDQQWGEKAGQVDFYDLKGDVEAILEMTAMQEQFRFIADTHPALHPGQCARIEKDGESVGWLGRVHPQVLNKLGIKTDIFVFELNWDALADVQLPAYRALSKYPSIRRDLAIVVDEQVSSQQLIDIIKREIAEILVDLRIFDVYQGKGVDSGRKSVALGLILQESSRTLTDQEVEDATSRVVSKLEKELGATLRD